MDEETKLKEEIEKLQQQVRQQLEAADERILEGDSGALIVKLTVPIVVQGEERSRLTVGPIRVGDVRAVRATPDELEGYADRVVRPEGAFNELLCDDDYVAVIRAAERQRGKYREGGRPS